MSRDNKIPSVGGVSVKTNKQYSCYLNSRDKPWHWLVISAEKDNNIRGNICCDWQPDSVKLRIATIKDSISFSGYNIFLC